MYNLIKFCKPYHMIQNWSKVLWTIKEWRSVYNLLKFFSSCNQIYMINYCKPIFICDYFILRLTSNKPVQGSWFYDKALSTSIWNHNRKDWFTARNIHDDHALAFLAKDSRTWIKVILKYLQEEGRVNIMDHFLRGPTWLSLSWSWPANQIFDLLREGVEVVVGDQVLYGEHSVLELLDDLCQSFLEVVRVRSKQQLVGLQHKLRDKQGR